MSETTKALFKDALYQVLDNKVFRLLVILVAFLVLPTFLIAAKPDRVVMFFGAYEYEYAKIFEWFGNLVRPANPEDSAATVIQEAQKLLVDGLAGTFGLIFAIAATAFFVPQMVEKGAADTVFSKPVSRATLFMTRYFAGILFVAILASVLVGGMYLGFALNSGYTDPGFLWSIPVVIYKYAVLHAFSLLVAVVTRSSIAAILTTLMFFAFNSCVHLIWQGKDFAETKGLIEVEAGVESDEDDEEDDLSGVPRGLIVTLDALHYTLPKTTDASIVAQRLRKALGPSAAEFRDPVSNLEVRESPTSFTLQPSDTAVAPVIATWKQEDGVGLITLKRWSNKERKRVEARKEFDAALAARAVTDVKEVRESMLGNRAEVRRWRETVDGVSLDREARFFSAGEHWFELDYDLPPGWRSGDQARWLREFEWSFRQEGVTFFDPEDFFEHKAAWGGELKYNLWFSIGSTLAWIALVLAFACWRLSRIDF